MAKFKNQHLKLKDNQRIYLGDDDDSSIYFDGTNLNVTTKVVGVDPTAAAELATKNYVDNTIYEQAQDAIGYNMTGEGSVTVTYNDFLGTITVSGTGASVAGASHADLVDLEYVNSGHTGFVSTITFNSTVDGIYTWADDEFIDTSEMTTISGDIVAQIISSSGVLVNYVDESISTLSGSIILDHAGLLNLDYASAGHTGFLSSAQFTTSSGDIIDYVDESIQTLSGSIVLDHGGLTGLTDDDHAQYILVNGTRAFTDTIAGVTPTDNTHLATKGYVDGLVSEIYNEGTTNVTSGANSVDISLLVVTSGTDYSISHSLKNTVDANPNQYMTTVTNVTTSGFTVLLSDYTDTGNYYIMWRATSSTTVGISQEQLDAALTDYYTSDEVDTISGAINSKFSSYLTTTQFTTSSGDIINKITYETLNTNGDVGTSAGQLAIGNHTHSYLANISEDSTPDLGGNLNTGSYTVSGTGITVVGDHGTATHPEVVNVIYGTGSPPTASDTTIGTIYIKYTA